MGLSYSHKLIFVVLCSVAVFLGDNLCDNRTLYEMKSVATLQARRQSL